LLWWGFMLLLALVPALVAGVIFVETLLIRPGARH
jgi:hypothetical protein